MGTKVMMNTIFPDPGNWVYDVSKPTIQTERLSWLTMYANYQIGMAGGYYEVDGVTTEQGQTSIDEYMDNYKTWLQDTAAAVVAWFGEPEESRALPPILAAPLLPAIIGGALTLPPGQQLKLIVDTVNVAQQVFFQAAAALRQNQQVRVLDKALNESSWWSGMTSPYLAQIRDYLVNISETLVNIHEQDLRGGDSDSAMGWTGLTSMIAELFSARTGEELQGYILRESISDIVRRIEKKPALLKLLLKAIITNGANIDEIDFDLADEE